MTTTIYIAPDGTEYRVLPRTWGNATNITLAWALAHGWTKTSRDEPEPMPPVKRYSKYKIQLAAQERSLWEQVKSAIAGAGLQDSWSNIVDIAADNPELQAALPAIREAFGSDTVDAVLEEAEIC